MPFPPDYSLARLDADKIIKPFDCGDVDLNDFLHNDSVNSSNELLTVTYLLESNDETIAFFSLLNDKIRQEDVEDMTAWNRFRKKIFPNAKRFLNYPAMKIGRLGVTCNAQNKKIGKEILDYLKILFVTNNRTGCRFITVDAYKKSIQFYSKNGFLFLTSKDESSDTRLMFFDLKSIQSIQNI